MHCVKFHSKRITDFQKPAMFTFDVCFNNKTTNKIRARPMWAIASQTKIEKLRTMYRVNFSEQALRAPLQYVRNTQLRNDTEILVLQYCPRELK